MKRIDDQLAEMCRLYLTLGHPINDAINLSYRFFVVVISNFGVSLSLPEQTYTTLSVNTFGASVEQFMRLVPSAEQPTILACLRNEQFQEFLEQQVRKLKAQDN
jgi:hypothetical protein